MGFSAVEPICNKEIRRSAISTFKPQKLRIFWSPEGTLSGVLCKIVVVHQTCLWWYRGPGLHKGGPNLMTVLGRTLAFFCPKLLPLKYSLETCPKVLTLFILAMTSPKPVVVWTRHHALRANAHT